MKGKKSNFIIPALFACIVSVTAYQGHAAVRPAYGGIARIGSSGTINSTNPARAAETVELLLARALHCSPAEIIEDIDFIDENRIQIKIIKNLVFHDGTRIYAEDFVRSLQRVAEMDPPSPALWRLLALKRGPDNENERNPHEYGISSGLSMKVIGNNVIEADIRNPELDLIRWLDDHRLAILGSDNRTGCGPFMEKAEIDGKSEAGAIMLRVFDRHPVGRPFLDSASILPLEQGAFHSFSAEIDAAIDTEIREAQAFIPDYRLLTLRLHPGRSVPELKKHISSAIDKEAISGFILGAGWRPAESLSCLLRNSGMTGINEDESAGDDNSSLAQNLRGGIPDEFILFYSPRPAYHRRIAERIQLRLHDHGINTVISSVEEIYARITPTTSYMILDQHDNLPGCPVMLLTEIAYRHGGIKKADKILDSLLSIDEITDNKTSSIEEKLSIIPLSIGPLPYRTAPGMHFFSLSDNKLPDPAGIWFMPDSTGIRGNHH